MTKVNDAEYEFEHRRGMSKFLGFFIYDKLKYEPYPVQAIC